MELIFSRILRLKLYSIMFSDTYQAVPNTETYQAGLSTETYQTRPSTETYQAGPSTETYQGIAAANLTRTGKRH